MAYRITRVDVWAADILNRPGMLARVLEALRNAGAEVEFLIARRVTEHTSRVFVSPIKGRRQQQAAADVGLVPAVGMHALCVKGPNRPGLAAEITRAVATAGINLRGVSAAVIGPTAALYLAFAKRDELLAAGKLIRRLLRPSPRRS